THERARAGNPRRLARRGEAGVDDAGATDPDRRAVAREGIWRLRGLFVRARRITFGSGRRFDARAGPRAVARQRRTGSGDDREPIARRGGDPLARDRARELPRWRSELERRWTYDAADDRAARFAHRAVHAPARRHVHLSLA